MAFLDILKSRKREEVKPKRLPKGALKQSERPTRKRPEIKASAETEKRAADKTESGKKIAKTGQSALAAKILMGPHVTEKTTSLAEKGVYTFKVAPFANKILVEKSIKEMYGFSPVKTRITQKKSKIRFVRGKSGIKSGFKKAVIYLKEGDKIEFI